MLFSVPRGLVALAVATAALSLTTTASFAEKKYDTGASDTEIKIGNIMPYCGPASAYGMIGKTEAAYFKMINEQGGINGRKINYISYDDAYSPPKTVEQARKLVEGDEVLFDLQSARHAGNTAIQKYMNPHKVPQLFVSTGAAKFDDPRSTSRGRWVGSRTTAARREPTPSTSSKHTRARRSASSTRTTISAKTT